jgi:heat shock protein HtpX
MFSIIGGFKMNNLKTMALMVTLTLMLVFIGALLGGKSGMTMALILAFAMNFITYWFSDKIVLRMYGAQEVSEAEAPELHGSVRRLALGANLPMPKVYLIDQEQPNAFCNGKKSGKRCRCCYNRNNEDSLKRGTGRGHRA